MTSPSKPAPETVERVSPELVEHVRSTFANYGRLLSAARAESIITSIPDKLIIAECERRGIPLLKITHKEREQFIISDDLASDFEHRSCLSKIRYSIEPPVPNMTMRVYPCKFCNGWHMASRSDDATDPPTPGQTT